MGNYSTELKLEIVQKYLSAENSFGGLAKEYGVNKADVQKWVSLYKNHGAEGLLMKKWTYSGDFKVSVVEYMHNNKLSLRQTAAHFGIQTHVVIGKWERIYYEEGPQALYRENRGRKKTMGSNKNSKAKIKKETEEDLIAEVQRLRMENAYLKKLQALVQERIARENGNE